MPDTVTNRRRELNSACEKSQVCRRKWPLTTDWSQAGLGQEQPLTNVSFEVMSLTLLRITDWWVGISAAGWLLSLGFGVPMTAPSLTVIRQPTSRPAAAGGEAAMRWDCSRAWMWLPKSDGQVAAFAAHEMVLVTHCGRSLE